MQKKVIVVGGGLAGLTAAAYLVLQNHKVTLLEASPKLGGRTYSFFDKQTNTLIDNGQHILMGCYYETLKFLSLIGAQNNFQYQERLEVNFVKEGFKIKSLKSFPLPYPFNLIIGLLRFDAIRFNDRMKLLKLFMKLPFISSQEYSTLSVNEWLESEKQSEEVQNAFWKILAVGALNTGIEKASAKIFIEILKQMFLKGNESSIIILPKFGLSESFVNNAQNFILQNGGELIVSEGIDSVIIENQMLKEIKCSDKTYSDFDFVISAIPAFAFNRIIGNTESLIIPEFEYSTILNIHIWLKENVFPIGFFGIIDSPLHWVFNKGTHLNVVISDANELANKSDAEVISVVKEEMKKYFLLEHDLILDYKIIKEKRATFIPSKDVIQKRPDQKTKIKNLVLAGDWVDTGLPSTIESAVKSGRIAAKIVNGSG